MSYYLIYLLVIFINLLFFLGFDKISKYFFFDKPDGLLKKHVRPVSLSGGLIFLINLLTIVVLLKLFDLDNIIFKDIYLYNFLFLSILFYSIGLFDDLKNLKPNLKLFLICFSVFITIFFFPNFKIELIKLSFLEKNYFFSDYSTIFLIFSFALLVNTLNMFDGINLQLILYTSIIFVFFIIKGIFSEFFSLLLIPLILLMILNYKNKIFLGDGGSFLISSILGFTFIHQYENFKNPILGDEVFIILLVPGLDMLRLFFLRIKNKKNPFSGDLNHLHHITFNHTKNIVFTNMIIISLCVIPLIMLLLSIKTYYILIIILFIYSIIVSYFSKKTC